MLKVPERYLVFLIIGSLLFFGFSTPCEEISKGKLRISSDNIGSIEGVCSCAEIRELSFKNSSIKKVPTCIFQISMLEKLEFKKSGLEELPDDMSKMTSLTELDLSFTAFSFLPEGVKTIPNLEKLILRGTDIITLPEGLNHLKKIDMRFIDLNRERQSEIREMYPNVEIYFSSPCQCD